MNKLILFVRLRYTVAEHSGEILSHGSVMDRHFVLFIMLFLIINSTYFIVRGAPGPRGVNVP